MYIIAEMNQSYSSVSLIYHLKKSCKHTQIFKDGVKLQRSLFNYSFFINLQI